MGVAARGNSRKFRSIVTRKGTSLKSREQQLALGRQPATDCWMIVKFGKARCQARALFPISGVWMRATHRMSIVTGSGACFQKCYGCKRRPLIRGRFTARARA
jgi:hypothetical protein